MQFDAKVSFGVILDNYIFSEDILKTFYHDDLLKNFIRQIQADDNVWKKILSIFDLVRSGAN